MSIFSKVNSTITRTNSESKAPGLSTAMDKWMGTIAAWDLARKNIFLVRIENPIDNSNGNIINRANGVGADDSGILNGLSDNALVSQGISLITNAATTAASTYLKDNLGAYSQAVIKSGFGDYYADLMGIGQSYIATKDFKPADSLGMMAKSVTLPGYNTDIKKDFMQRQKKDLLVMGTDFDNLSMVVRSSSSMMEYAYLTDQLSKYINNKNNKVAFPDSLIFPQILVYIYNRETNAVATAIYNNCYIASISALEYDYDNNNEEQTFTVEFTFEDSKFMTYPAEVGMSGVQGIFTGASTLI